MRDFYREFGRLIRERRKAISQNQTTLANSVGLSRTSITNIELGRQQVALHMLYALANALGIEPQVLLPAKQFLKPKRLLRLDQRHLSQELAHTIEALYERVPVKDGKVKET